MKIQHTKFHVDCLARSQVLASERNTKLMLGNSKFSAEWGPPPNLVARCRALAAAE